MGFYDINPFFFTGIRYENFPAGVSQRLFVCWHGRRQLERPFRYATTLAIGTRLHFGGFIALLIDGVTSCINIRCEEQAVCIP